MVDIEGINERLNGARHYVTCPKARNECKQCDDWFYSATNVQSIIRSLVTDIDSLMNSRDDIIRERDAMQKAALTEGDIARAIANELDELRTRHSRLIDSTDTFVAALVDERFKKDHASMVAELSGYRAHSADVASTRANIDAILRTNSVELSPDNKSYANKTFAIDRAMHKLRDECRQHLARINVLDSEKRILDEAGDVLDASNAPPGLLVDRIEWLAKRDTSSTVIEALTNSNQSLRNHISKEYSASIPMILHCPSCNARHIDAGKFATKSHHTHACQSCGTVWRPAIVATVGVQFLPGFKDATTLPANESTGQDVAKVEDKAKDATSANVVPDDVMQRAISWANRGIEDEPTENDEFLARAIISGAFIPTSPWSRLVAEFVKLWREGQAPDRPLPVFGKS